MSGLDRKTDSAERLARQNFEALTGLDPFMSRAEFLEEASNIYVGLAVGHHMLGFGAGDLQQRFGALDEKGIVEAIDAVTGTHDWLRRYCKLAKLIEMRALIAAARVAVAGAAA